MTDSDWALSPRKVWLVTPADEPPLFEDGPLPGTAEALAELEAWARDIDLRTYGVAAGIDPPEMAKLRNETMRTILDNIALAAAPTSAWTRGIAAVAVAEKKKAAESPKDIVEERNDVRGGWLWQVRTRRDGIVRERRLGRHDPSAADGFVACD